MPCIRSIFTPRTGLFVGDRANNRLQIFDQDGKFLAEWAQFSRPSGLFIYKETTSSTSPIPNRPIGEGYGHHPGFKRGIRTGSAKDGIVTAFIPDPSPGAGATSTSERVAADSAGNVYGAEVGPKDLKKYVHKPAAAAELAGSHFALDRLWSNNAPPSSRRPAGGSSSITLRSEIGRQGDVLVLNLHGAGSYGN
jgi:hypothetical protein